MSHRLGIDFGTSNTVVALWDPITKESSTLEIPEISSAFEHCGRTAHIVPSLINYAEDGRTWIGAQVNERGLQGHPHTIRWIKRYIAGRSQRKFQFGHISRSATDAGTDFLSAILLFAAEGIGNDDEEYGLTVPVDAFEFYTDWLTDVADQSGRPRFRLIDEPSAAALGYGASIQPGNVYLVFDFGGGTLDLAVVLVEESKTSWQKCRVLAKAGADIGGADIDRWIFQELLKSNGLKHFDDEAIAVSNLVLQSSEKLKIRLSSEVTASTHITNPQSGRVLDLALSRERLAELLEENKLFSKIDRLIRTVLREADARGFDEDSINSVFMVGGSCFIPAIKQTLARTFGSERIYQEYPLDAIARGAAAFVGGVEFFDYIQHDYAIKFFSAERQKHEFKVLIPKGTCYPSKGSIQRYVIKATNPEQRFLGIQIYEMGQKAKDPAVHEIVFDVSGAARLSQISSAELDERHLFWLNEKRPTFLEADPPAQPGESIFEVQFSIDGNKHLLLTARDLRNNQVSLTEYPVVRLN